MRSLVPLERCSELLESRQDGSACMDAATIAEDLAHVLQMDCRSKCLTSDHNRVVLVRFVDLRALVLNLEDFEEADSKCGERVLEAIQMNWIEEIE